MKTKINRSLGWRKLKILLFLFSVFWQSQVLFAQTSSGVSLNWDSYVGCQQYGEIRDNSGKDPILIDDIIDGQCITVCNESTVTFTLTGNLAANPNTTWSVVGGTIISQSNNICQVTWSGLGNGSLSLTTTSLTGTVTKTICFEKVEIPKAIFTIAPFSNPDFDLYGCALQTIYFNNLSTTNGGSGLYSYFWDFGDGGYSNSFAPTHIYQNDGTYSIKYIVTNSCGCSSGYSREIKIGKKGFDITCPSVMCEGQTDRYSLPFDGAELCHDHYNWNVVGGHFIDHNDGTIDVTWDHIDESGFGYVTFDPSACNLSCGEATTIKIPVIQTKGTITGNATTCLGSQERYILPQWPATLFNWTVVDNAGNTLANVIHTDQRNEIIIEPLVSGTLVLRCEYQNTLLHCGGTAEFTINVINAVVVDGPESVCQFTAANYFIASGESTSWILKDNAGATIDSVSNSTNYSYNFAQTGNYTITTGGLSGCNDSIKEITVVPTPNAPTSISGSTTICPNAPYTYTIPGSNANGIYQWQVTGGTFIGGSTGNSVVVQFDSSATHVLSAFNQTQFPVQCTSATTSITINKQQINASISSANGTLCANVNASYTAVQLGILPEQLYIEGEIYTWSIWNSTNTAPMPSAGSVTTGQGTNAINVLWNNTNVIQTITLRLVIQKCTLTQTFTKIITVLPVAQLVVTTPVNSICSGSPLTFTLGTSNGIVLDPSTQVTWNYGNGVSTTTTGLSTTYSFNNTSLANIGFNITASITNPNGCIAVVTSPVKVITVLPAPNAAISLTSGGNVFCPPTPITTVLTATVTTGATKKWYKAGSTTVLGTGNTLSVTNAANMGYGSYYLVATNAAGCSTTSNYVPIMQICPGNPCTVSPEPSITNTSTLGCFSPTTTANCDCGMISLVGSASGSPSSVFWDILGPNAANSYSNYTGTSIPNSTTPLEPGDYNIFYKAVYTCTNGQTTTRAAFKKITVPYVANFSYTVQCNGSNFSVSLLDTSPYYAPVTARTFKYYTGTTASGPWTLQGTTQNYTISSLPPGNYFIKQVITGTLAGVVQTPCEKIIPINLSANTTQTINAAPIPVSCFDTSVKFSLNGPPNSGDTYLWDFGDGATNTLQNPDRVFSTAGAHTITLQITNKYGCLKPLLTYTLTVPEKCFNGTVTSTPTPAAICAGNGNSITLQYTPSSDNCAVDSYTWMNGTTPLGLSTPSIQVASEGFYWVKVKSAAPNLCAYDTPNRISPVFYPAPTLEVEPLAIFCQGVEVPITIITNATTIRWFLDYAPYNPFNDLSSVVIPAGLAPGTHPITITVTSANGCTKSVNLNLVIANSPLQPSLTATLISCEPYIIELTASGTFGSYLWSSGQSGNTITVTDGGPYQVTIAAAGCSVKAEIDVPKNPEEYMWIFPSGCFTNCSNSLGTLIGPSVVPFSHWEWLDNGYPFTVGTDGVTPFDLTHSGTYNLTLDNGLCTKTSNDLNYTLVDCPHCPLEVHIEKIKTDPKPFCHTTFDLIVYNASGNNMPITVTSPNNDVILSPNSFISVPGLNIFHLTAIPINGFTSGTVALFVIGFDTKNDELCNTPVLIELKSCEENTISKQVATSLLLNSMVIAPNPAKETTTISFENATSPTIEVYSLLGVKLATYNAKEAKGNWELNTSALPTGVYIVVMKENNSILLQKKLMKE